LSSENLKCPNCNVDIEEKMIDGESAKCRSCGAVFLYAPKKAKKVNVVLVPTEEKTTDQKQKKQVDTVSTQPATEFNKVIKCPHCDKFIILKIPVIITSDIQNMTKNPAEKCPKCKGKRYLKEPGPGDGYDVACDKCGGIGAVPIENKKDD
jgi:DNA-directed RNA polymerase subunit M/transcription elongation factor TFIIS